MTESAREGMGGMAAEEGDRTKDADSQAAGVAPRARLPREADELAVDLTSERAGELERIALTAPEDARGAEERRRDVDHPHLVLPRTRQKSAFSPFPSGRSRSPRYAGGRCFVGRRSSGRARSCSTRSQLPSRVRPWR